MNYFVSVIIPIIILLIIGSGKFNKEKNFDLFLKGVKESFEISINIFPTILGIFFMINIFLKCGLIEDFSKIIEPYLIKIKFPKEIIPLAIFRPISGSGAMGIMKEIIENKGVDSLEAKIASTIVGATETTIYTIILYTTSQKMKVDKKIIYIGLTVDFVAIISSIFIWKKFF